jgi:hypothetical protein
MSGSSAALHDLRPSTYEVGIASHIGAHRQLHRLLSSHSSVNSCLVLSLNPRLSKHLVLTSRNDNVLSLISSICSVRPLLALGLEGSANKLGAGIIRHNPDESTEVLSNVRHTYVTPPGEGFQPKDTALHHREWIFKVVKDAVKAAGVRLHEIDCICYTKGKSVWLMIRKILYKPSRRTGNGSASTVCCSRRADSFAYAQQASCWSESLRWTCV